MKDGFRRVLALLVALALMPPLGWAAPPQQQELSDKDKKKMAEIAQRPEVQDRIRIAYDRLRRQDMEFAYNVNTSTKLGELIGPQWADFRAKYGQLYDNPMLQRYVNSLGQRLVPRDSPNLYGFRLLLDPVPRAEALSTGTVYISTGLVSLLDNEAQLAYILAHELAHVERNHFYARIRNEIVEEEFWKEKEVQAQKRRSLFAGLAAAAGGVAGGLAGGGEGALIGALGGLAAGSVVSQFVFRNKFEPTEWDKELENEADEAGLKYMLEQNYDAREIPRLYARLDKLVARDARIGLGFIGSPQRSKERTAQLYSLMSGTYKSQIDAKLQQAGLTASSPNFSLLMSALKRDNGIIAMDYDLFAMAKDNLEEAANLRSNDSRVYYHLGRLTAITGRTPEDRQQAVLYFAKAMQYDADRGIYPEPHLENALHLIAQNDPATYEEVLRELKAYVALFQRENAGRLPNNMHILYDYAALVGDKEWYVPPAMVVSTSNVQPIYVMPVNAGPSTSAPDVIGRAVGRIKEQSVPWAPPALQNAALPETKTQPPPPPNQ
jgi:hypothetical protein